MEYRDQLKYIKSHQVVEEKDRRKRRRKRKKISAFDKGFWNLGFGIMIAFLAIMVYVDMFPIPYIIAVAGILIAILMVIKILQQRACRYNGKKRKSKGRLLLFVTLMIMIVGGYYLLQIHHAIEQVTIEDSEEYTQIQEEDVVEHPFNIYISGIDVYGEITQESRSDVNLIVTLNPAEHKILITTTPRDYYVKIPGVSGEYKDKLTHAGIYGIDVSMATLGELYSTEIPFYGRVNFSSVIDIVDAMGGVDVESEVSFTTSKASGTVVDIKEGMNHLNGKEALAFVRERKAFVDGDNQRGKNQQALLKALIKQAISPMMIIQAKDVIDSVVGNAETNMSEQQIKSLIKMQLDDLKGWEIETVAAKGDDSGKQYCYSYSGAPLYVCVPDMNSVAEITDKINSYLSE